MLLFAADLRATGELRDDLTDRRVADLVWSMNSPEYFGLLAARGSTPQQYAEQVADVWCRSLLGCSSEISAARARSLSTVSIARW